jgi:predicted ATPase
VRFVVDSFTPHAPGDGKYADRRIPGLRIVVTDRDAVRSGRVCAAILSAVARVNRDSLRIATGTFDERFGSAAARVAIMRGEDPDSVMDREDRAVAAFLQRAQRFRLYPLYP